MNKRMKLICALAIAFVLPVFGVEKQDSRRPLHQGIEYYKQSDFKNAAAVFRGIAEGETAPEERGDAYFWLAKSLIALESYDDASQFLEHFMKNFSSSPYYPEAFYERGRLLYFQQEYDTAVVAFQNFLARYPDSEYSANAFFWTGEALFSLGNLPTAERMFTTVVNRYPTSSRAEAARYRIALIDLKYREEELLKLLKWSHEEYLKSLESRENLERTYTDIVASYQRQIAALNTGDLHAEVIRLTEGARVLRAEVAALKAAGTDTTITDNPEFEGRMQILSAREEALKLKETYLNQLIEEYERKK